MPPPFIRCNLVKRSMNPRWKSVRSLAYTTCSDVADSSSVLFHPLGKFKVIETLDQIKKEQSSALLFGHQLKESGFKHDVETYMAIVRLLCHLGMHVRLNNLFMNVIQNDGFEISHLLEALIEEKLIKAIEVLVKVYASVGRFEEAIHTLSEMRNRSGLRVSTITCNYVMNELIEWDKVDMIESVYTQLKSNGLIPNVYTYGTLIKAYITKGRLIEAKNVLNQMEVAGVALNAFIISTFVHELCSIGENDLAFEVLKNLRESNHQKAVDVSEYACVIRGFVQESRVQDAEDVFVEMKRTEVVPDAACYGALMREYLRKGDTAKELDLRKEMESRGIEVDYAVARSMMQSLVGLGMYAKALDTFKGFTQSGVFLDGALFNIAIDAACKLGRMEDAMGLVEEMKDRKINPRKMHYRTLMNGYCLRGEPLNALHVFQEMMRNGLKPASTDYHVLARGKVFLPFYMLFKH